MKIKNIFNVLMVSVLAMMFSCTEEAPNYEPGTPDMEECYNVYFPKQESELLLDPNDPMTTVTINVARKNTSGAITVPFTFTDTTNTVTAGEIKFEDGQSETTCTLNFENIKIGQTYKCDFLIEDPLYGSKYNNLPVGFTYSILKEKWNALGKCKYSEDIITAVYIVPAGTTWEVEIEESDAVKGLYRLKNVYGADCPFNDPGDWDETRDYYMIVHAEDPKKVYIELYISGTDWGSGKFIIGSIAGLRIQQKKPEMAEGFYGTNNGGIITFPKKALLFGETEYKDGGLFPANGSGAFKIVLPGVVEADYSISVKSGYTDNGVLPVEFKLGTDIAKAKYAIYEGSLNKTQIGKKVAEIMNDTTTLNTKTITASGTEEISLGKTGIYTLVAVPFDTTATAHEPATVELSYVAENEEVPVLFNMGILENTPDTLLQYYILGKDLTGVKVALFRQKEIERNAEACIETLMSKDAVPAEILDEINNGGYSDVFSELTPGTDYVILAWATNNYEQKIIDASAKTSGELVISIKDVTGAYSGMVLSAAKKDWQKTNYVIEESDNAEAGNIMFTQFLAYGDSTTAIYATLDMENNDIIIPVPQLIMHIENTTDNINQDIFLMAFDESSNPLRNLNFAVTNIGKFGIPSSMFGLFLQDQDPEESGFIDLILDCDDAERIEPQALSAGRSISAMMAKSLSDFAGRKLTVPSYDPDFSIGIYHFDPKPVKFSSNSSLKVQETLNKRKIVRPDRGSLFESR